MRARPWLVIAVLSLAAPLYAYPVLAPRPVPDAIAGPTDPHVAAAFYNPAALAFLRGLHGFLDGGARINLGSIDRDPVQGRDGGSTNVNFSNLDSFAGISWDLNTNAFAVGLAMYTPFTELSSFPDNSPVRYQERWQKFLSFEQTLAVAWRPESHFSIGGGFIVDENWIDLRYARDAAPAMGSSNFEDPANEQGVRLRGFGYAFGFSAGLLIHPVERLWIGASYTNHQAGGDVALNDATRARVKLQPDTSASSPVVGGDDRVVMLLPEMVQAGLRVEVTPELDVEASFRFVHYGARSALDVSLQGGGLSQAGIAPEFLIDRGMQNAYMVEVSTRHRIGQSVRLSPSLLFESSAVAPNAVSAAALEGNKIDATLTLEWRAWHGVGNHALYIGAHAGGTFYLLGHVNSRFNSAAEVECVQNNYALEHCISVDNGDAWPSASGNYRLFVLHVGGAIGFTY